VGHHFAGPGNPFWRLLHASGLTGEPLDAAHDRRLVEWRLALTNVCPRATRAASDLTRDELQRGCRQLRRKVRRVRPAILAFVGLSIYRQCVGRDASSGAGEKPHGIAGARVFVLPNPSGLNAAFPGFRDKLIWFERLAQFAGAVAAPASR
jgi:TDG/mug DNA glycosylase family protein